MVSCLLLTDQHLLQAAGAADGTVDGSGEDGLVTGEQHFFSGAGDGGIDQLSGQEGGVGGGQDHQDLAKLRTLAFVDGHGKDCLACRQPVGLVSLEAAVFALKPDLECAGSGRLRRRVREADADVAVEEVEAIVVVEDNYRPTGIPASGQGWPSVARSMDG